MTRQSDNVPILALRMAQHGRKPELRLRAGAHRAGHLQAIKQIRLCTLLGAQVMHGAQMVDHSGCIVSWRGEHGRAMPCQTNHFDINFKRNQIKSTLGLRRGHWQAVHRQLPDGVADIPDESLDRPLSSLPGTLVDVDVGVSARCLAQLGSLPAFSSAVRVLSTEGRPTRQAS